MELREVAVRPDGYPAWRTITGRPQPEHPDDARIIFEGSGLIQEAVLAGLGVGFVRKDLCRSHMTSGRLTAWDVDPIDADWAYILRLNRSMADDAAVRRVVEWLGRR